MLIDLGIGRAHVLRRRHRRRTRSFGSGCRRLSGLNRLLAMAILTVAAPAPSPAATGGIRFGSLGTLRGRLAGRVLQLAHRRFLSVGALPRARLIALVARRPAVIRAAFPIPAPLAALFPRAFAATAVVPFTAGMLAPLRTVRTFAS